jgi:type II secretory pathway predicted ATPase ExeA
MKENTGSRIENSMLIRGEVRCNRTMVLDGRIEGSFIGGNLVITPQGRISGEVHASSIECAGEMEGQIVTSQLILRSSGRHIGTVETGGLVVEPGAVLDCALQTGVVAVSREATAPMQASEEEKPKKLDLQKVLRSYSQPLCCMDVPWSARQEMYRTVLALLAKNKPLIMVYGEAGSGKSTLARKLQDNLPDMFEVLAVEDLVGSVASLLQGLATALGLDFRTDLPQNDLLEKIRQAVMAKKKQGRRVIWIIDDFEQMYPATLEGVIKLLTNAFDHQESGFLQMIIMGVDPAHSNLVATVQEYFEDEINCMFPLKPMSIKDTADYLRFCLQVQGGKNGADYMNLFPYETIRHIHSLSYGNIGEINRLADRGMIAAFKSGASEITVEMLSAS